MRIIEIVAIGLKAQGFDGLYQDGICGCQIGDLSPGNCLSEECRPGYRHTHSTSGEWIISKRKEGVTDRDIEECVRECC